MKMRLKLLCVALIGYASVNLCRGAAPGADAGEGPPRRCCPDIGGWFGRGVGALGNGAGTVFGKLKGGLGYISGGINSIASRAVHALKSKAIQGAVNVAANMIGSMLKLDAAKQEELKKLMHEIVEAATLGKWKEGKFAELMPRLGKLLGVRLDGMKKENDLTKEEQEKLKKEVDAHTELLKTNPEAKPSDRVRKYLEQQKKVEDAKAQAKGIFEKLSGLKNPSAADVYDVVEPLFNKMEMPKGFKPKEQFDDIWSKSQSIMDKFTKLKGPATEFSETMKTFFESMSAKPSKGMKPQQVERAIPVEDMRFNGKRQVPSAAEPDSEMEAIWDQLEQLSSGEVGYAAAFDCIAKKLAVQMDNLMGALKKASENKKMSDEERALVDAHKAQQAELEAARKEALKTQADIVTAMENFRGLGFEASSAQILSALGPLAHKMSINTSFWRKWNNSSTVRAELSVQFRNMQNIMFPPEPKGRSGVEKAVRRVRASVASVGAEIHRVASVGAATAARIVKNGAATVNTIGEGIRRAAAGKSSMLPDGIALALSGPTVGR